MDGTLSRFAPHSNHLIADRCIDTETRLASPGHRPSHGFPVGQRLSHRAQSLPRDGAGRAGPARTHSDASSVDPLPIRGVLRPVGNQPFPQPVLPDDLA
ncbi:hypothetical protein [Marinovum sp.]|uniref:hypothetical protein n=1 Tax=Marinovum sp. TaxID=2024839 RepID=UPI002B26C499|nr:hypothetical protein [Marinovum sp.]